MKTTKRRSNVLPASNLNRFERAAGEWIEFETYEGCSAALVRNSDRDEWTMGLTEATERMELLVGDAAGFKRAAA